MKPILFIHAYDINHYINCVFFSVRLELRLLWQPFSLLWLYLVNSQMSVNRTIGPLVICIPADRASDTMIAPRGLLSI